MSPDQLITCWHCLRTHKLSSLRLWKDDSGRITTTKCCPKCSCRTMMPVIK